MRLRESYLPKVGPFYVIDGIVFADTDDVRDVIATPAGFKDSNNSHDKYWRVIRKYYPEYRDVDYDYYPRGRVVYNTKDDKYYLYADKCIINNPDWIDAVEDEFSLPHNKVIVSDDDHYQCHECNEDYVSIFEDYTIKNYMEDHGLALTDKEKELYDTDEGVDDDGYLNNHW